MKKLICISVFFILSTISYAQKPVVTDEDVAIELVTKEMDEVFQSEDFLKKKNKKYADIKGKMVVDIGVIQSGKVSTFFKVESDITNIDFINFMSEYILTHKFKFKLQKKQRFKIRYTITF
ncbi:hypothetical protein [Flavobacterium sp.]|jgi:hypothetical protein|uniref:hypothetical protein n=1 Tax=Flavobacterium sp. TaxID=239 RepID=UPI0035AE6C9A